VSGGEVGARFGPSLMPGGHPAAWERLRPIWEAGAHTYERVDAPRGKFFHLDWPDPKRPEQPV
jgi:6-phosphogluconate dehydrogenase